MIRAVIIHPDDTTEDVQLQPGDLKTLQRIVGGWLEAVYGAYANDGRPQMTIFINEEGKIHNLPVNRKATSLWWAADPQASGSDVLVGTVIVAGGPGDEGELLPIPDQIADMLT